MTQQIAGECMAAIVWRALVDRMELSRVEIVEHTRLTYTQVGGVLHSLHRRGFAQCVRGGRAARWKAIGDVLPADGRSIGITPARQANLDRIRSKTGRELAAYHRSKANRLTAKGKYQGEVVPVATTELERCWGWGVSDAD